MEKKNLAPKMSAEIKRRQEWENDFKRAEAERESLDMSREQYSRHKLKEQKEGKKKAPASHTKTISKPLSPKGSLGILERVEDKIAKFVEKYSVKKYKRQL